MEFLDIPNRELSKYQILHCHGGMSTNEVAKSVSSVLCSYCIILIRSSGGLLGVFYMGNLKLPKS